MNRLCAYLFLMTSIACTETPVRTGTAAPQAAESAPAEVRRVDAPELRNGSLPYFAAFSDDAGETFSAPVQADVANPAGHVDVVLLADGDAAVSWLDGGTLHVRRVSRDGTSGAPVAIGTAVGFPRLAVSHENVAVVWTASDGAHFATIERL